MSNKSIEMNQIRQLLRLYASGKGSRHISANTGIARNTIKKYLLQFVALRITMADMEAMSDAQLATAFLIKKPVTRNQRVEELQSLLPALVARLRKRGVTKGMLYEQYAAAFPGGFKHSAFLVRFNQFAGLAQPTMRIVHKAGDKLFIDFTGKRLRIVDPQSGEIREVEVFVSILGCSQLTFAMAVASQKKEDFIYACEEALRFYSGVPQAIVPDNLKSAVKKASRYESELNGSFAAFAAHYDTFVFPTRAYRPKDKALVEGAVKIIYTTLFTKIDDEVHHTLQTLNASILLHLDAHNNTLLTGCDYSRRQQFESLEKDILKPLNKFRYDPMSTRISTVSKTGYVPVEGRFYSIPYKYIGKKVKVMFNTTLVEAYHAHEVIASHVRSFSKEKYIQNEDHLASWHRYPTEWNPEKFIADGAQIDGVVAAYITQVLERNEYPEKNYRACQGIINFRKRVGDSRLINACKRAHSFGVYNYGIIERILLSRADFILLEEDTKPTGAGNMPTHDNIRGEEYYQ